MPPSDPFAVIGQELDLNISSKATGASARVISAIRLKNLALIPSRSKLPPTSSCTNKVFSMRMRKVSRASPSSGKARASASSKTLCRAGEKHEVQQHIKMEDDENERREDIKAQERNLILSTGRLSGSSRKSMRCVVVPVAIAR